MKLRLFIAFLSLAAVGAVFYVRAANNGALSASPASAATCDSCCDGPSPASVLPNPYKADAKPIVESAPATPAKS